jgi:cell division protein FtsQ
MALRTPKNNRPKLNTKFSDDTTTLPFMRRRIVVLGVSVGAAVFACAGVLLTWKYYFSATPASENAGVQAVPLLQAIKNITYSGELNHLRAQDLQLFSNSVRGNIWSVDLNEIRAAAQAYPWVRTAEVRRSFPDGLAIRLEEHKPFAKWGNGEYSFVNTYGEVFELSPLALKPSASTTQLASPSVDASTSKMPVFIGPAGSAPEVLKQYEWLQKQFAPLGRQIAEVHFSIRGALRVRDNRGTVVELGRLRTEERLARVLSAWPHVAAMQQPNMHIDARYPSGLALSINATPVLPQPEVELAEPPPIENEKLVLNSATTKIENMLAPQIKATGLIR